VLGDSLDPPGRGRPCDASIRKNSLTTCFCKKQSIEVDGKRDRHGHARTHANEGTDRFKTSMRICRKGNRIRAYETDNANVELLGCSLLSHAILLVNFVA